MIHVAKKPLRGLHISCFEQFNGHSGAARDIVRRMKQL